MAASDGSPVALPSASKADGRGRISSGRRRFGLQISLAAILFGAIALTGFAVHLAWSSVSRAQVSDLAMQMNADIVSDVSKEVGALFHSTEDTQQTLVDVLSSGMIDTTDADQLNRLFFSFLRSNKNISWVSYGKPNGDFLGAQRRDDANYRIVKSLWDARAGHATRNEIYVAFDGGQYNYTHTKDKPSDYYSPNREWFTLAAARPGHVWTDVYVFATSGMPGINTATAHRTGDTLEGVVSIAIELERISRYLKELAALRNGTAFIVDRNGQMVAFKDPGEVVAASQNGEEPRRRRLDESWNPQLRIAQAAVDANRIAFYGLVNPRHMVYESDPSDGRYFVTLAPIGRQNWIVGTVVRENDFLVTINDNWERSALAALGAMLLAGCAAIALAHWLFMAPLGNILRQTREVERFNLAAVHTVPTRIREIHDVSTAIHQMSTALHRMSLGLQSVRRFLPAGLVEPLLSEGIAAVPGGERRTLTILFTNLSGFSAATERLGDRIVPLLSDYLGAMTEAIVEERGTVDKYVGAAVMAFWGAPAHNENHATDACRAALRCLDRMRTLEASWKEQKRPTLHGRIGINTGRVVVGNIGSAERLNYTVIGDPVNLTSHLGSISKDYGCELIISQATYELAKHDIVARCLDGVTIKGRDEPVRIYELLAMADESGETPGFEWVAVFERALGHYQAQDWPAATREFERVISLRGDDKPSRIFLDRLADRHSIAAQLSLQRPGAAD
jgi:adenylate cyclase